MSAYQYNLTIYGNNYSHIEKVISELKQKEIIPHIIDIDYVNKDPGNGPLFAELSSESVSRSRWNSAEHDKILHELSLDNPGMIFELYGEDYDDPNNGVFKKAFQDGLYKEVFQEKQDVDTLLKDVPWRKYGAPEKEGQEAEVFKLFGKLSSQRNNPVFQMAYDMAYMEENIELEDPLTTDELYTLACKLEEARGSWFGEPLLHEEHLDAIRYLMEYGLTQKHSPEFPELSAEDTRKLLLTANNEVFGTLIEVAAINNQKNYYLVSYNQEDIDAVIPTIETARNSKSSLADKIAEAQSKANASPDSGRSGLRAEHQL